MNRIAQLIKQYLQEQEGYPKVPADEQLDESYEKCLAYVKELGFDVTKHNFRKVYDDIVAKVGNDEEKVIQAFNCAVGKYSIDFLIKENNMGKFITFLEKITAQDLPKKQWVDVDMNDMDDELIEKLWSLYEITYKQIGLTLNDIQHLKSKYRIVKLIDIDDDVEPDAFIIVKNIPAGNKIVLLGSDNNKESKRVLLDKLFQLLKSKRWFIEASHKVEDILHNKGISYFHDKKQVEKILEKPVTWLGDGKYSRNISNKMFAVKTLFGQL